MGGSNAPARSHWVGRVPAAGQGEDAQEKGRIAMPMRLTLLGTGTPAPSLDRQSAGYVVDVAGDVLVFDHGPGAHHRLLQGGRHAVEVTHVFLSHLHYDHCLDYARLVLQRWDQGAGRIPDIDVYGPPPVRV